MAITLSVSPVVLHTILDIVGCILLIALCLGAYAAGCYVSYKAGQISVQAEKQAGKPKD